VEEEGVVVAAAAVVAVEVEDVAVAVEDGDKHSMRKNK
jgi:hypothetical protein